MNRLVLRASVAERGALRWTPAGLPALDLTLTHESVAVYEGTERKVALQIKALAIGSLTSAVSRLALDAPTTFCGFLAAAHNGRGVVFHITELA